MNSAADNTVRTSSISEISSLIPTAATDNQQKNAAKKNGKKRRRNKKTETAPKVNARANKLVQTKGKDANTGHIDYLAS